MQSTYTPLEPTITQEVGLSNQITFTAGQAVSLFSSISFLWTIGIILCVAATGFVWVRGGLFRMEASEAGIRKSNEEFKRGSLGLLGVMGLFLIIYTVNKGLLIGDINLDNLRSGGTSSTQGTVNTGSGGQTGGTGTTAPTASCSAPAATIAAVQSGNVCGNVSCTSLSGCNYQQYSSIINQQASAQGVDPKIVIVLMCKESRANRNANGRNTDGTYDCGLMQVNQTTPCDASSLDPALNIARGVALIKQKSQSSSVNQVYPGVPQKAGLFASYNCCSNGTTPNAPSADCNASTGFNTSIPKWACPINPGTSASNMCAVKSYACELTACLNSL